jgi:hypothetical protein
MASYRSLSIAELTPGSVLATPVFDEHLFKLLDAGTAIDQYLIDRLGVLGVTEVVIESSAEVVTTKQQKPSPKHSFVRSLPIEHCGVCGNRVALHTPAPDATASMWLCTSCNAIYFGRHTGDKEQLGVYRVDSTACNPFTAGDASSISLDYVRRLVEKRSSKEFGGSEQRLHKRYPAVLPVVAVPLASDFRVSGEPVRMATANVSLAGASLIHTRFVDAPYLAIDYSAAGIQLQVVFKVVEVRSLGLVYEVAGEFISRISRD